jgi:glyoxylase-like metal-dependent hydrolase (beta-lactamase superfamily II)
VARSTGDGKYQEPRHTQATREARELLPSAASEWAWKPLAAFPAALDLFGDNSLYVIDAPGHLYGHVNLLARVGEKRYVYLGGDCCHDPRILRGEKGIALYDDGRGGTRSVHVHTDEARRTLDRIGEFVKLKGVEGEENVEVEVVVAHDGEWRERNSHRFWPGTM